MFGIPDFSIWIVYVLSFLCLAFATWFGIRYWNEVDEENGEIKSLPWSKKRKKKK